jgi:hypothetical protein
VVTIKSIIAQIVVYFKLTTSDSDSQLFRLAAKLRDLDILVLDTLLGHVGYALRSHDPERFRDLFLAIATRAKETTANGEKTGSYATFLLNSVTGLKNNKQVCVYVCYCRVRDSLANCNCEFMA